MSIYENGLGDRLIDPLYFPKGIRHFLADEKILLESLSSSFDWLIEVGCMDGRYLPWAVQYQKGYIGIDVVPRYIEMGRKRVVQMKLPQETFRFFHCGAENLFELLQQNPPLVGLDRCLIFFPFNSFGNIADPLFVIKSLKRTLMPFLISSYQTTKETNCVRRVYYENCGFHPLCASRLRLSSANFSSKHPPITEVSI